MTAVGAFPGHDPAAGSVAVHECVTGLRTPAAWNEVLLESGWPLATGFPDRPAILPAGALAEHLVALHVATAALAGALVGARRVSVDPAASLAGLLGASVARWQATRVPFERSGDWLPGDQATFLARSRDGEVLVQSGGDPSAFRLAFELDRDPPPSRFPDGWAGVVEAVRRTVAARTSTDVQAACQALRVPTLAVRSRAAAVVGQPLVRRLPRVPVLRRGPVPPGGRPLAGIRVVDLTAVVAGPYASWLLSCLGAEVVRVERPGGARPNDPLYRELQRGKRIVGLDLATAAGRDQLMAVLAVADVLVENFAPRVLDNWGLTPEILLQSVPRLVGVSLAGFGRNGVARDLVAYGSGIAAASGIVDATRYPDGRAAIPALSPTDYLAGAAAAFAVVAGLARRLSTGCGGWIDLPQIEVAGWALANWCATAPAWPRLVDGHPAPALGPLTGRLARRMFATDPKAAWLQPRPPWRFSAR